MKYAEAVVAPGSRVWVRDAEWLVRRVDRASTGGQVLSVVGLSEIVKDKEAVFLERAERSIEILNPADTSLVQDPSPGYQASLLYMESLLRQTPPTDENLYVGHRAAMDRVAYQLEPALQALRQPRQRILIADAVGLGKTLEAGILLSELIRRGRGKRILVVAIKSMLTQFQKEMWSRFTIPLTRLDSVGIQRIRSRIPTHHNPFFYYDKAIVSVDTLKQDTEYRTYLENAWWDVIVIDEAQNVAERGSGSSLRAKLANLLAQRSDTLIMLSATPHDGKARSFASLMNMLDPTAIADPDDYGPEDIRGLFIRRFKKDIQSQVEKSFQERRISKAHCRATDAEEAAFARLADLEFTRLDQRRTGSVLFKTTLEKALFSSPAACLETIGNRVKRLEKQDDAEFEKDVEALKELGGRVEKIGSAEFGKYHKLVEVIRDGQHGFGWSGRDPADRLVIFTERIETLRFLETHLPTDLNLKPAQVEILHGGLSDMEQQRIVDEFGRDEAKVRLLIASDVASEGINLHYLCHRMIHFDVPWSLMVFQQRNGRIDRYGQEREPQIVYLVTESANVKIRGDMRILELLIQKDEEAIRNIGDPSALMGVYDIDEEERITASAIEQGKTEAQFEAELKADDGDFLDLLMGGEHSATGESAAGAERSMPSLYPNDYTYFAAALQHLRSREPIQADLDDAEQTVELTAPEDLLRRFRRLPREVRPRDGRFVLSADPETIEKEIRRSRRDESTWPTIHYLWELNPVLEWINDKVLASFGRREAPVIHLPDALAPGETVFIVSGLIPNRKSHPLVHRWFGVRFQDSAFQAIEPFEELLVRTGLGSKAFPNRADALDLEPLRALLPEAVDRARAYMREQRKSFEDQVNPKLNDHYHALERLKERKYAHLERRFENSKQSEKVVHERIAREKREIERIFEAYLDWVQDTMSTEDNPYLQAIAVLTGESM